MELIVQKLLLLLVLFSFFLQTTSSPYSFHNTSFTFPLFNYPNIQDIINLEGSAFVSEGALQLTDNQRDTTTQNSVGRAAYTPPIHLWDRVSGNIADFTTTFSLEISFNVNASFKGDGLAFFLIPNGSAFQDDSYGGRLGLLSRSTIAHGYSFVAVEFDTYFNDDRDPDDGADHVGIDVNSLKSDVTVGWDSDKTNRNQFQASVEYSSVTRNLTVRVTDSDGASVLVRSGQLSQKVNLSEYLTEWVWVGFSAATGESVEIHKVFSWTFNSTLQLPNETLQTSSVPMVRKKEPRKRLGLLLGIGGAGALLCVGLITLGSTIFLCRGKRAKETTIIQPRDEGVEVADGPRKFSYDELMVATNNFSEKGLLGEGGFGRVYLGLLRGETNVNVAVKRIAQGSQQGMKEYLSEVRTISRLRHKNLVQLLGWCHEQPHDLLLIYEFMSNNNLDFHLLNNDQPHTLTWPRRYTIAMDLANVLFYLQEWCDPCILHRDIKLSNVLLTLNFRVKLGDFGLARLVEDGKPSQTSGVLFGTEGYIAPEYADSKRASKESDIYSLGVVLVQLACGKRAIGQVNGNKVKLVEWLMDVYERGANNILEVADSRLQGIYEEDQMERLMVVGLACVQPDYFDRPTIREVVDMLNFKTPLPSQLNVTAKSNFIMSQQGLNYQRPNYHFLDSTDASGSNKTRTHSSGGSSSNSNPSRAG